MVPLKMYPNTPEEIEWENHRVKVYEYLNKNLDYHLSKGTIFTEEEFEKNLDAALYAASELGVIEPMYRFSDAIEIWKLVEKVRHEGFPRELRM